MTYPGSLGNAVPEEGLAALWSEIRQIRELIGQLQTAKVGNRMVVDGPPGIIVNNGGGIAIQGGGDVTLIGGDLIVSNGVIRSGNYVAGTSGFRARDTGNLEVNDLTLRGGIIGNDALANPVQPKTAHSQGSNFSLSTSAASKASATITVPAGFSQALVLATMSATAVNNSGGVDFFDGYADINAGGAPGGFDAACDGADGRAIGISHTATALLTGLGASFTVRAMLRAGSHAWTADAFNAVNVDALILFLR